MYSTANDAILSKEFSFSYFSILTNLGAVILFPISRQVSGKQFITHHLDVKLRIFINISATIQFLHEHVTEVFKCQFRHQLPHNNF